MIKCRIPSDSESITFLLLRCVKRQESSYESIDVVMSNAIKTSEKQTVTALDSERKQEIRLLCSVNMAGGILFTIVTYGLCLSNNNGQKYLKKIETRGRTRISC